MIFLFNNEKKTIAEITVLSHDQKMVLNGAITATVTAVYDPEIESAHYFGAKDIDDPNVFWMYRIISQTKENGKITLSGVYLLFDELQGGVIRDIRPQSATPAAALSSILSGSGWQVGTTQTTGTASGSYYYQSRLSAFYDFLQKWAVEFKPRMTFSGNEITGRYIDIYDQISADYGKRYEYGDKLIHVVAEQANEGIYTALIGRGKGEETESGGFGRRITFKDVEWSVANGDPVDKPIGQDYVSIPSAVDTYGFREGVVEFTDTEDPELLLEQTYAEAVYRSRPRVEFKSDVIETGRAELGETVSVIRDNLGIRYKTRIFELNRNFLNKKIKSFKFGDKITATAAERIKEEAKKVEEKIRENQSVMFEVLAKITDSYWNEDGFNYELLADNEYGLPAGYYSFDRPIDQDPTKVVYMGAGKVLIADSKNVNDEWAWRTALTPEGLVGSEIIAHSITANQLASDVGQSLDLSSNESINLTVSDKVSEAVANAGIYTWIRYADDAAGNGISANPAGKIYMGLATRKTSETPSDNPSDYKWSLIQGPAGAKGQSLVSSIFQYYRSTSISSQTGGSWQDSPPDYVKDTYLWTRLKQVWENPADTTYTDPVLDPTWGKIHELDGRTTTNESNISQTATAVASKVSQSVYDAKMGTFTGTVSEIKQTADNVKFSFDNFQVGGENLIKGSQALADKFETYQGSTFTTVSDNMTVPEWDTTAATKVRTTSLGTRELKARWVISDDLAFLADKEMSFSIYAKNNRDNVAVTIGTNRIGEPITLAPLEMKRLEYIGVPAGNEGRLLILELSAPTDGHYLDVTLFHPKWELGNTITDWSPHPDEFITGNTTITGRGINVSNNVDDTNTDITPSGMVVKDNLTNKPILEAIDTGVMAPLVRAEEVYAPNLINSTIGNVNLYVAATATGDGSGRDSSNRADSIYTALNVGLKGAKYLFDDSTVKVSVSGAITEDVYLGGYIGGGELIIDGNGSATLKGSAYVENCSIEVTFRGFKHYKMDTGSDTALYTAENSTNLYVINNTIIGNGAGYCYLAWRNGGIHSENNDIVDFVQTYRAWTNSIVSSDGDRGSRAGLNGYIAYAGYGGRVALAITRPLSGTPGSISGTASGGAVDVTDATGLASTFNPDTAPPAPTYSTQTKTFYATRKRENRSQNNWFTDNEFGQGTSPTNGTVYRGHAYLYGAIRSWLLGSGGYQGTPSIRMRAKRGSVWGLDSSPPALKLTAPYAITTSTATRGSITPWVTLSSSARDAIIAGNDHFNTTSTSKADYSSWDWIQFEVTASKR